MWNAGPDEAQVGIKIARRNINNLRYADDTTLMAENEEELKSPLMKMKEESEKVSLKVNIQKTKIMASGSITSWQIDGETMETVTDFIFLDTKITADGDFSHEIKRCFLLGRKAMTILNSILKSRDITLPTKVCLVKAMVFTVVMYGCESWAIKKAECWRIDAFELWCWRRLLRVPWTARRSTQLIIKEINPEIFIGGNWCWGWSSNTLTIWCKDGLIGKDPDAGKEWQQEEKGMTEDEMVGWHHRLNGHEFEQSPGDGKDREAWHAAVHGVPKSWTWLSHWTATATTSVFLPGESHGQRSLAVYIQSIRLQRMGHDWSNLTQTHAKSLKETHRGL